MTVEIKVKIDHDNLDEDFERVAKDRGEKI
jgi:hypothetical protein